MDFISVLFAIILYFYRAPRRETVIYDISVPRNVEINIVFDSLNIVVAFKYVLSVFTMSIFG